MRLKKEEIEAIKGAVYSIDPDAEIYLFGSRTDPLKKGGDIDILILSLKLQFEDKFKIIKKIFDKIEEQKIDIIIATDDTDPFVKIALSTGIKL